jgi:glycosyltransferase involved in cell wall biosynthesis
MAEVIPEISVLIIARNAAETMGKAIQSMLNQSMGTFELLIYDDASEDDTAACIKAFSDVRIRLISGREHKGIPAARNILLREARGRYIAWLDADDWSFPQRLEQQWNYLEQNPDTDLLFSWIEVRNGGVSAVCMPADGDLLRAWLMFRNPFAHSTMMARNFFAAEGLFYDETMARAQDYELYLRLAPRKQFAMWPEILVSYDAREGTAEQEALPFLPKLLLRNLEEAGLALDKEELLVFLNFLRLNKLLHREESRLVCRVLNDLRSLHWPIPASISDQRHLLLRQWFRLMYQATGSSRRLALWKVLLAGPMGWWGLWRKKVRYGG